jgi:hypothetical protein
VATPRNLCKRVLGASDSPNNGCLSDSSIGSPATAQHRAVEEIENAEEAAREIECRNGNKLKVIIFCTFRFLSIVCFVCVYLRLFNSMLALLMDLSRT